MINTKETNKPGKEFRIMILNRVLTERLSEKVKSE